MSNLKEKVIVVTGATGYICSELCRELSRSGANIVLLVRNTKKGKELEKELFGVNNKVLTIGIDIEDIETIKVACDEIIATFGRIDALINGIGGNNAMASTQCVSYDADDMFSFCKISKEYMHDVIESNFFSMVYILQVFATELIKNPTSVVINISSISGRQPISRVPFYCASKAAVDNLTKWLAAYFAEYGMRVNAVAPGFMLSEQNKYLLLNDGGLSERGKKVIEHSLVKRFGTAEDVVNVIMWLLSEKSSFVTGTVIEVDGGFLDYVGI